ncbi:MAG: type I glyceraldehyde-3-phosphate dehydrogenase [Candidatus Hermodarchaeia archaeon]|jgi:glyceraldehyde 3-phosphate dehydrogenase
MVVKVAINGLGRIGRNYLRGIIHKKDVEIVAANDLGETNLLAHLLQYDSIYGRYNGTIQPAKSELIVDNHSIKLFQERDPSKLPWKQLGVDIAIEATGVFRDRDKAALHLQAGARKVIISAPGKGEDAMFVLGVNDETYDPNNHHIISNASCTTNCFAPVIKVLLENYGIKHGFMSTIHGYTLDQRLLDAIHKDYRRARAAAINIIPTTTGAANAIIRLFPQLEGKIAAMAYRVPIPDGSIIDLNVELEKSTTKDELNKIFHKAAQTYLKGILQYNKDPIVSTDIIGNPHSSIFDSELTQILDDNFAHVVSWYDNEAGFSTRLIELTQMVASKL